MPSWLGRSIHVPPGQTSWSLCSNSQTDARADCPSAPSAASCKMAWAWPLLRHRQMGIFGLPLTRPGRPARRRFCTLGAKPPAGENTAQPPSIARQAFANMRLDAGRPNLDLGCGQESVGFAHQGLGRGRSSPGCTDSSLGCPKPSLGFTDPKPGRAHPSLGFTDPKLGRAQSSLGFTDPGLGFTYPDVGFTDPSVGRGHSPTE